MIGADGGTGGSGVGNGAPDSQSHNERLSGRRARPSHDGGPFDQIAQPPSCHAIMQMMNSRRHIVLMPLLNALSLALAPALAFTQIVLPNRLTHKRTWVTKLEVDPMVTCLFRQGVQELSVGHQ